MATVKQARQAKKRDEKKAERDTQSWAEQVKKSRYGNFTKQDLENFRDLLQAFVNSVEGKIDSMAEYQMNELIGVYGATQPARIEKECRAFLANIAKAIEKQRP